MKRRALLLAGIAAAVGAAALGGCGGTVTANVTSGATYKSVTIGSQTWMAENLNVETSSGSWCYENSADNCAKYGRLYTWETAGTVCPAGWHLPTKAEWEQLVTVAGDASSAGKKLKAKRGWSNDGGGTDGYGFSALPGGLCEGDNFSNAGDHGVWWTATESSAIYGYYKYMGGDNDRVDENDKDKSNGFSVRCVKD